MTTESITHNLARVGLSDREQQVYLALLEIGTGSVLEIAKKAGVERTGVYGVLRKLIEIGLVAEAVVGKKRVFIAQDPKRLVDYARETAQAMTDSLPELQSLWNATDLKPRIRYFEGVEGMRTVLEDVLTSSDKELRAIVSAEDLFRSVGERWFEDYTKRRIRAGFSLRVVRSRQKDLGERWPTSEKDRRVLRYAPEPMVFSMTMYVYSNKVILLSTRRENFGMIIESDEFAEHQRQLFEALWVVSKPS